MSRSDTHRVADMLMATGEITDITARGRAAFDDDVFRSGTRRSGTREGCLDRFLSSA